MKPIIAIATQIRQDKDDQFVGQEYIRINEDYIQAVSKAGGIPMPLADLTTEDLKEILKKADGLLLSGGLDVDPLLYGENEHPKLGSINPKNDRFFINALEIADLFELPVLGICKGHQLINVAYGGSLYQDLNSQKEKTFQHFQKGSRAEYSHKVFINKESFLGELYKEPIYVNSFHHQALKKMAEGFDVAAKSEDGIIEAIEHKQKPIYGIQWHPEMLISQNEENALKLMRWFVELCKSKAE